MQALLLYYLFADEEAGLEFKELAQNYPTYKWQSKMLNIEP